MISAVVVFALIAGTRALPALQSFSLGDDGAYQFFYETGQDAGSHSREETRGADGVVVGKYSYQDPSGDLRVVNYRADDFGYVAKGDVSVPGAPPGQFPTEDQGDEEQETKDSETTQNTKSSIKKPQEEQKESSTTEAPEENDDDYEDDIKSIKLQEPSYDGPPDGFPVGFFGQNFQGLRRLPEPTPEEDEKTSTTSKDEGKDESSTASSDAKPEEEEKKKDDAGAPTHLSPLFPFTNVDPHAIFNLYQSASDPHHHPVYVYSYNQPESHGYYYSF